MVKFYGEKKLPQNCGENFEREKITTTYFIEDMIKAHHFREALGLTQEETATLLKIRLSQLSMFEIGQRDLPANVTLQLVQMYNHVQDKQQEKLEHVVIRDDETKIAEIIAKELLDNRHAQMQLERKIKEMENKYRKSVSALHLAEYLESQPANQEIFDTGLIDLIRRKAIIGIEKYGLPTQVKYTLRLNALQHHQAALEKERNRS